jgi:hypothetical protein
MKNFFSIRKSWSGGDSLPVSMVTLGNSFELPVLFRNIGWRIVSAAFASARKLPSRLNLLKVFAVHIRTLTKNHGAEFTVKYLKACQLAVQKSIAGSPLASLKEANGEGPFPYLSSDGLPRIIPKYDRSLIRSGSASVIRY